MLSATGPVTNHFGWGNIEDSEDIVITITNNSNHIVDIQSHELLCRICYKKL